jgi:cobalt-zinc-cadmium efflux system outer membrane protein
MATLAVLNAVLAASLAARALVPEQVPAPVPLPPVAGQYSLEAVTLLALGNSPALRQAWARVEQSRGLAIQAGLYPNPTQNSGNPNQLGGDNSLYSVGVTQEVVRAGKIRLNRAAAEQAAQQAYFEFVARRFDLLTSLRLLFFARLAAERRVQVFNELAKITDKSVETAERLREGGQITERDVLLLRIEAQRIEVAFRAAQYARTAAGQQLAATMGLPQLRIDHLEGDLTIRLPDFENALDRSRLIATNSLVESARVDISRTQFLLRRAQVEPVPNLTLNSGYQWTVNQPHSQALVGLYFPIPIWDRNQGNIRAADANVRQSMAQVSVVQNQLTAQVAEALGRYRTAQATVELYERDILPDARKSLELAQAVLNVGELDILRLLQTQRLVFESNLDYIAALQERLTAAANLAGLLQLDEFP